MKHEMPAVTEERRAELVNLLINRHAIMAPDIDTKRMEENMEIVLDIALAALTEEAVGSVGYAGNGRYEFLCMVWPVAGTKLYATPPVPAMNEIELPEPYDDGHGNLWLPKDLVISAIKKSGGEVK